VCRLLLRDRVVCAVCDHCGQRLDALTARHARNPLPTLHTPGDAVLEICERYQRKSLDCIHSSLLASLGVSERQSCSQNAKGMSEQASIYR
jgi:hypothetical protein